jgi:hypothetical protein
MHRLACLVLFTAGCAAITDTEDTQDSSATTYVNIVDFGSTDQGAWSDLGQKLNSEFVALCGDTFCEGDYSNYTPLSFYCSVSSKEGSVKDCAWTFAASQFGVDANTAAISFDVPAFQCHVHPKTTAAKLIAILEPSADAIHEALPGTTSIYDSLADCFAHPIGSTPITATTSPTPTYVDASVYYTTPANQAKWTTSIAELKDGFDYVCGDTFCSGDFNDLWSMQVSCAITKSTGNVKACQWSFAGSQFAMAKTGVLTPIWQSWKCPVAVKGTLSQLIAVLAPVATDPEDYVNRPLPGGTDAYDSIGACLP